MNKLKNVLFIALLTSATIIGSRFVQIKFVPPQVVAQTETETQFICATSYDASAQKHLPTTFAWTPRGKIAIVRWQTELAGDWTPLARCEEVSPRFEAAYSNNTLGLITNGTMDNQRVICTAIEPGGACDTLLMTLRPEDDSVKVLNQLNQIFNGDQVGPVKQSSSIPQIYYKADVEEFLRTAPVEK